MCCLRLTHYKNHVIFNIRCKKLNVIPHSLSIRSPVDSKAGHQIALKAGRAFVRERVRISEWNKREAAKEKQRLESGLRSIIGDKTFERFLCLVNKKYDRVFNRIKEGQRRKLEALVSEKNTNEEQPSVRKKWVVNMSSKVLTNA